MKYLFTILGIMISFSTAQAQLKQATNNILIQTRAVMSYAAPTVQGEAIKMTAYLLVEDKVKKDLQNQCELKSGVITSEVRSELQNCEMNFIGNMKAEAVCSMTGQALCTVAIQPDAS